MSRRLTIQEIKNRIYSIHGDNIVLDESTYVDTETKAIFIDKDYGPWSSVPSSVLMGVGHKIRGNIISGLKRRSNVEQVKERIYKIHGDTITLDESSYIKTHEKARFIDKDYGEWWSTPHNIIQGNTHYQRGLESTKKTNLLKYGYDNPAKNEEIKKRIKKTCLITYGTECSLQNKEVQKKSRQTNLSKYGYEYAAQNPEIALKGAIASNQITYLIHWKSEIKIPCRASYEVATVNYFNSNKIDYIWQIHFKIPRDVPIIGGFTYTVDGYLPDEDIYIEVKGYMRKDAQEKWDWFHATYPNSELWDFPRLKELEIL